jgi:hypothetical protein
MKKVFPSFFLAAIFLGACALASGQTAEPTATFTPLPSRTPAPSATASVTPLPSPTKTPVPTPTPQPFSSLREISQQYLAANETEAVAVARSLAYLQGSEDPSNMCGPLAAAILQEGGILSPYINLHDFWLLNPRVHQAKLARIFPKNRFVHTVVQSPISAYDFKANPLQRGDFLYLYAGANGNFEHMLVVTHVDETGRAYTVTNVNTDAGYIIDEFMLYDPEHPQNGLIARWNNRDYAHLGLTGSGGFEIWHPLSGWEEGDHLLSATIDEKIANRGGDWHILMQKTTGERIYARSIHEIIPAASTIKVPLALLFFKSIESEADNLPEYLASHAIDGRSYEQLLYAMLVKSEEPATGSIYRVIQQKRLDINQTLLSWGIEETDIPYRRTTVYDLSLLLDGLYRYQFVSAEASETILQLMSVYTENDDGRIGVLKEIFPSAKIYDKRGTLTDEFLVIADIAIIEVNGESYQFLIFGLQSQNPQARVNNSELEQILEEITQDFGLYLQRTQ